MLQASQISLSTRRFFFQVLTGFGMCLQRSPAAQTLNHPNLIGCRYWLHGSGPRRFTAMVMSYPKFVRSLALVRSNAMALSRPRSVSQRPTSSVALGRCLPSGKQSQRWRVHGSETYLAPSVLETSEDESGCRRVAEELRDLRLSTATVTCIFKEIWLIRKLQRVAPLGPQLPMRLKDVVDLLKNFMNNYSLVEPRAVSVSTSSMRSIWRVGPSGGPDCSLGNCISDATYCVYSAMGDLQLAKALAGSILVFGTAPDSGRGHGGVLAMAPFASPP